MYCFDYLKKMRFFIEIVMLTAMLGCAAPQIGSKFYLSTGTIEKTQVILPEANQKSFVKYPGADLKNKSARITFFPSTTCRKESASKVLKSECQLMIAMLERTAAARGYEVVSWSILGDNPWEKQAEEQEKLDAVFVVDEVNLHWSLADDYKIGKLAVGEQTSATEKSAITLDDPSGTQKRCYDFYNRRYPVTDIAAQIEYASVSIHMASADRGFKLWEFQDREMNNNVPLPSSAHVHYFESKGSKKKGIGGIVAGGVLTAIGIGALATGIVFNQNGNTLTERNVGAGLAWGSSIFFGIGLPIGLVGIVRETRDPVYPKAEQVLCVDSHETYGPFGLSSRTGNKINISATPDYTKETADTFALIVERFFTALGMIKAETPMQINLETEQEASTSVSNDTSTDSNDTETPASVNAGETK